MRCISPPRAGCTSSRQSLRGSDRLAILRAEQELPSATVTDFSNRSSIVAGSAARLHLFSFTPVGSIMARALTVSVPLTGDDMATTGTIKRLVPDKGFGFIAASDGSEYFFHQSGCQSPFDQL